jgi:uncharacterized protein (DUF1501 family)
MDRRRFFATLPAASLALCAPRVWAAPSAADTKLLVVMLRGACDGLSLLVPYASSFYYESRPSLAVPRPGSADPNEAVRLDATYALNAATRDALLPLWSSGQLAFVPFAGSSDRSRSHFQAQDLMELGQGDASRLDYGSGFLNRLVTELGGRGGVSFTQNVTPVFKGTTLVANVSLRGGRAGGPGLPERQAATVASMYEGTRLGAMVQEGMDTRRDVARTLSGMDAEMEQANRGAEGAGGFERQARAIATLMKSKPEYAVAFVDVGGWDTHVNQGAAQGQLASNLRNLSAGIAAFAGAMGPAWQDAIVVVVSEFGRTVRENGNRGTDHGHGNVMWLAGGRVKGGIAGRQTALTPQSLYENRDLPVLNDYRAVLGAVFASMYGLDAAALDRVFPGVKLDRLGLV